MTSIQNHSSLASHSKASALPPRVRFAPSPTGFLHIGGVRVALYNWLYARQHGGAFLLRIEDTDEARSDQQYTEDFIRSLQWLGLNWDEEPLYQSQRMELYRQKADQLVEQGLAYHCHCSEADVEKMRETAMKAGAKPRYDRTCRERQDHPAGPFVIRAKLPLEGEVTFHDLIRGDIQVGNADLDDFVLIRSNGLPTYNLSVVVDDVLSRITHVMRGDDHINNTPKQMHLYHFFKYPIPQFAHLRMILGADKKKLSKRHGAVSANVYRAEGYLTEALLNFLVRLGWSHGDQEEFTIDEMVQFFAFDHVQKSAAVFNTEKLMWLNGAHLRRATAERLLKIVEDDFRDYFTADVWARVNSPLGVELVRLVQPKIKLVKEIAEQMVPLCKPGALVVEASGLKWNKDPSMKSVAQAAVKHATSSLSEKVAAVKRVARGGGDAAWGDCPALGDLGMHHVEIDAFLRQIAEQHGMKLGDLAQPMRLVVGGPTVSAGLFDLLAILPWDLLEERLNAVQSL